MKRLALVCVLAASSGCAFVNAVARGDIRGAAHEGGKGLLTTAQAMKEGDEKAEVQCKGMDTQVVPLGEERAIGGAIAVGLTHTYKAHVFIDGNSDKNPVTLAEAAKTPGKVTLPDSAKNDLNAYVSIVGRNLAAFSPRPEIVWTFGVIDSPTVNAFSAPGGYVYVTTGLLKLVENEAQLAGILAHEIGHVSGRHALKGYTAVKYEQCRFATKAAHVVAKVGEAALPGELRRALAWAKYFSGGKFDLDSNDMAASLISALTDGVIERQITQGNAKPDELEADKYAVELSAFAGYDADEYAKFLQKLPQGKGDTHPPMAERLAALNTVRADIAAFAGKGAKPDNSAQLKVVKN